MSARQTADGRLPVGRLLSDHLPVDRSSYPLDDEPATGPDFTALGAVLALRASSAGLRASSILIQRYAASAMLPQINSHVHNMSPPLCSSGVV